MTYPKIYKTQIMNINKSNNYKNIDIINILGISKSTYYRYRDNYKFQKWRRSKITPAIKCFIRAYVILNINFICKQLIYRINSIFNVLISASSVYNILKQLNFTKKKIYYKYVNKTQNRNLDIIKFKNKIKTLSFDDIISLDETSIDTHIRNGYGWSRKRKKINKIFEHSRKRYSTIMAISTNKIIHHETIFGSVNGEIFLKFIEKLNNKLTSKKYILLDNARIHHYKKLKNILCNFTNIEFIFNIPYSPEYNPIEHFFNELKNIIKKVNLNNIDTVNKLNMIISSIDGNHFKNYFKKSLTF